MVFYAYVAFLFCSTLYRIQRLRASYARFTGQGSVHYPFSYFILLTLYVFIALTAMLEFFVIRSNGPINFLVTFLGLTLYAGVIPVRQRAITILGSNMSPEVEIKKAHTLVKEGPYSYLRHPLALCVLIELAGFTLVSNSYYAFLGVVTMFFPFLLLRIFLEERALSERFGEEYLQYKREVFALLPFRKKH